MKNRRELARKKQARQAEFRSHQAGLRKQARKVRYSQLYLSGICPHCGGLVLRNDRFDTYFCAKCNRWLDPCNCGDADCPYCPDRPAKPSMVTPDTEGGLVTIKKLHRKGWRMQKDGRLCAPEDH